MDSVRQYVATAAGGISIGAALMIVAPVYPLAHCWAGADQSDDRRVDRHHRDWLCRSPPVSPVLPFDGSNAAPRRHRVSRPPASRNASCFEASASVPYRTRLTFG